jgi:DNA-binding PadR family transcriptional regulator
MTPSPAALGEFEQLVLLALVRLGDGAYGVSVRREIHERTARDVSLGAVYKTLDRLDRKGYVASYTGEPTAERGGRRKRHYRLEPLGLRALRDSLGAIGRMTAGLPANLKAR